VYSTFSPQHIGREVELACAFEVFVGLKGIHGPYLSNTRFEREQPGKIRRRRTTGPRFILIPHDGRGRDAIC
jgi:hypothetical protein